ncbi:MAG: hypothetical protein QNK83_11245 [Akkermansiaceae bacterium]
MSLDLADYKAEEIPEGESLMEDPVFLAEWNGEIEPELDRITSMKLEGVKAKVLTMPIGEANWLEKLLKQATRSRLTRIVIELERYRLQKKRYPKSLDEMELTFSIEDLTDPEGRDLRYEKTDNRYFHLWSEFGREEKRRSNLEWKFPETGEKS